MGLFRRRQRESSATVTINRQELEDTIVEAYMRIKESEEVQAKEKIKTDDLSYTLRNFLQVVFYSTYIICLVFIVSAILSFFLDKDWLSSLRALHWGLRVFLSIATLIWAKIFCLLGKAVGKEKDRNFLVGYFSAFVSLVALLVSLATVLGKSSSA